MSFIMGALSQYRAVLGSNNANFAAMQGRQGMMSNLRNASRMPEEMLLSADKKFAMNQATNNLTAKAYDVELDSMEKAKKRHFESFNYFA